MKRAFGFPDPLQDARRVRTAALFSGNASNSESISGGLENKIYLWPSDGSPISTYDPTEAGLIVALSVTGSGDTAIVPSVEILISTALTLNAGAALIGFDENSILSFSGMSGTLLTMAEGARLQNLSIRATSDGIGITVIDAQFEDVIIKDLSMVVYDGVSDDIGILSGA